mgnify:CR=1 FL=1
MSLHRLLPDRNHLPEEGEQPDREIGECLYYYRIVGVKEIPAVEDDEGWARIGQEHDPSCEWIDTRAHQI